MPNLFDKVDIGILGIDSDVVAPTVGDISTAQAFRDIVGVVAFVRQDEALLEGEMTTRGGDCSPSSFRES